MTANEIEVRVAMLLNYRVYTIVPNVSWGLGLSHECDMLALDTKGRFTEIEIKTTASDLKADFNKSHGHKSKIISRLFYAMPLNLCEKYKDLIPAHCGIISIQEETIRGEIYYRAAYFRQCRHKVEQLPDVKTIRKFMELGCMRIWTLKAALQKSKNEIKKLKNK